MIYFRHGDMSRGVVEGETWHSVELSLAADDAGHQALCRWMGITPSGRAIALLRMPENRVLREPDAAEVLVRLIDADPDFARGVLGDAEVARWTDKTPRAATPKGSGG